MTRLLPPFLFAILLSTGASHAQADVSKSAFFPYPLKILKLKNGLTVVRVPFASPGLVAYYSAVRVGSRNEVEAHHTGFAHFFEHVMFKGTKKFPEGSREKLLGSAGFNDNAFTTDDVTLYHAFGPTSALDKLIEVEADRFQHLEFSEQTFQTESKAVLGEYHKTAAQPELKIEEQLNAAAFTVHPYRHTTLGFYDDILKMPAYYAYSREFFKRWYTPDNVIIFVVGDFNDNQLIALIQKHYGSWTGHAANVKIPVEPPQTEERSASIMWPSPTLPRWVEAWHTPAAKPNQSDGAVQEILVAYLVGATSPVYKELVLEKQLVDHLGSSSSIHRDPNLFTLQASLKDEKNRSKVQAAVDEAVHALVSGTVEPKRLEDIKSNLKYGILMSLETADEVALQLAWYAAVLGPPDALDRHLQNVSRVKPSDLVAFAKRHFNDANRTVLSLTSQPSPAATR